MFCLQVRPFLKREIEKVLINECSLFIGTKRRVRDIAASLFSPPVHYLCSADPIFNTDRRCDKLFQLQLPGKVNEANLTEVIVKRPRLNLMEVTVGHHISWQHCR